MTDPTETSAGEALADAQLAELQGKLGRHVEPYDVVNAVAVWDWLAEVIRDRDAAIKRAEKAERQLGIAKGLNAMRKEQRDKARAALAELGPIATELQAATADHRDARAAMNAVVERWSKQTVDEREAITKRIEETQKRLFVAEDAWMAAGRDWPDAEPANRNPTDEQDAVGKRQEADGG